MAKSLSNLMLALSCAVALVLSGCGGGDGNGNAAPEQETAGPDTLDLTKALSDRMKTAKDIGNPVVQANEYLEIARELQLLKNFADSVHPLNEAIKPVDWMPSPADQGRVRAECAVLYSRAKKPEVAKKEYEKAVAKLAEVAADDLVGQTLLLAHLASAEHELGKKDEATARLKTAKDTADKLPLTDKEEESRAGLAVAKTAKLLGDKTIMVSSITKLRATLDNKPPAVQAEMPIAAAELEHGFDDADLKKVAEEHLQNGIDAAQKVEDKTAQAKLLIAAAAVRNAWSQPDKAKPLLDQAEKLLPSVKDKGQLETLKGQLKIERFYVDSKNAKSEKK